MKDPRPLKYTLRALSMLLRYPDAAIRDAVPALLAALDGEAALDGDRRSEVRAFAGELLTADPLAVEARYVELFDRGRSTSLHLFEHVHGDSRDRGPAMVDLVQHYAVAGLHLGANELPDHLCVVLEFASTQPPAAAKAFLGEMAHILKAVFSALRARDSAYATLVAAVLELAGEKVEAVAITPDEALDAAWAEPEAFGGCSTQGQARPDTQPIRIVRRPPQPSPQGARP